MSIKYHYKKMKHQYCQDCKLNGEIPISICKDWFYTNVYWSDGGEVTTTEYCRIKEQQNVNMKTEIPNLDDDGNVQQCAVSGSLPLIEFIEEIEYMMRLYGNQRYTQAEAQRDRLAEKLDDIMRLGGNDC